MQVATAGFRSKFDEIAALTDTFDERAFREMIDLAILAANEFRSAFGGNALMTRLYVTGDEGMGSWFDPDGRSMRRRVDRLPY